MDKWNTMVGSAAQYAAMDSSKYMTLDFLSEQAKKSILWACAESLVDLNGDDQTMPDPKYIVNFSIPVQYTLRNEHGLSSILSQAWVIGFSTEFIGLFIDGMWTRAYRENEWFDKQKETNVRLKEYGERKRQEEISKARKVLEDETI